MRGIRGSWSLLLAAVAVAELAYIPAGRAQDAPPPGAPEAPAQGGDVAPPPGPPQPYGQPPGPPQPYGQPPTGPFVTLRATNPKARLQVQTQLTWRDVCLAPCNRPVDPAGVYRVGGGSLMASDPFNMPRPAGPVVIEARVGSKVKRWVGIALMIGGIGALGAGTAYYVFADDLSSSTSSTVNTKDYYQISGIVYGIIGVVLLSVGIPLSLSSTSVTIQ